MAANAMTIIPATRRATFMVSSNIRSTDCGGQLFASLLVSPFPVPQQFYPPRYPAASVLAVIFSAFAVSPSR
jgi:hypothetical protein